jgi:DNA adenine methylase
MHYLGSKAKHADQILAHVLKDRRPGQLYVEPFVGGGNVLCRVPQEQGPRLAADYNPFMVAVLKRLSEGWEPRATITRPEYEALRDHYNANRFRGGFFSEDEMADVASVALGASFGSLWFGSWANDPPDRPGLRWGQARRGMLRDAVGHRGANFVCSSFDRLEETWAAYDVGIPDGSLWYCDPPYRDTTGYDGAKQRVVEGESGIKNEWRPGVFWRWADSLVERGHTVFVSEYSGPTADSYDVPVSDAQRDAHAEAGRLQREIDAAEHVDGVNDDGTFNYFSSAPDTSDLRAKLAAANEAVRAGEELRSRIRQSRIDRWKVVWRKSVKVNVASYIENVAAGDRTELLFTRSPE